METLTENRLNDIASAASFQVHERSSYHHSVNLNYAKCCHGPPKNRLWPISGPWPTGWESLVLKSVNAQKKSQIIVKPAKSTEKI